MQNYHEEALMNATPFSRTVTDDGDVALVIKYIGTGIGQVLVTTNGDIYFFKTTSGTTVTLDTAVSGGGSGFIDVSNAAYDTYGEVLDRINSFTNWKAMLVAGLRTDSSNSTLLARTRTGLGVMSTGIRLFKDSSRSNTEELAVHVAKFSRFERDGLAAPAQTGWQPYVRRLDSRVSFNVGNLIYRVFRRSSQTTNETEIARYGAGATGANNSIDLANGQLAGGVAGEIGDELVVKIDGLSTIGTFSSGSLAVQMKVVRRAF